MNPCEIDVLECSEWKEAVAHHHELLGPMLEEHLSRKSQRVKHPVVDFLFEYYPFRPSHLSRWSPGSNVFLKGTRTELEELRINGFSYEEQGGLLQNSEFPQNRRKGLQWVLDLLRSIAEKPPRLGCRGLHEWAMVYNPDDIRHIQLPFRLSHEQVRAVVEQGPVQCTHYDAFRFFSEAAKPFNLLQPLKENRYDMEQPGCLHVNMDLYKWASKFHPWVSSDLIREAFFLAVEAREIDMRASPYDLAEFGYTPIRIETPLGQQEYSQIQMALYTKAIPIRARIISKFAEILEDQ